MGKLLFYTALDGWKLEGLTKEVGIAESCLLRRESAAVWLTVFSTDGKTFAFVSRQHPKQTTLATCEKEVILKLDETWPDRVNRFLAQFERCTFLITPEGQDSARSDPGL